MRLYSNDDRPAHLGRFPLEQLPRSPGRPHRTGKLPPEPNDASANAIGECASRYIDHFARLRDASTDRPRAPIPDDPVECANNLKASAYFFDATLASCCCISSTDWLTRDHPEHTHALVVVREFAREPEPGEAGAEWVRGSNLATTNSLIAEICSTLAIYVTWLGFTARGHFIGHTEVDLAALADGAGLALVSESGELQAPFLQRGFAVGVVTTDLELADDGPLDLTLNLNPQDPDAILRMGSPQPACSYREESSRPLHLGRYPMETLKRVPCTNNAVVQRRDQAHSEARRLLYAGLRRRPGREVQDRGSPHGS